MRACRHVTLGPAAIKSAGFLLRFLVKPLRQGTGHPYCIYLLVETPGRRRRATCCCCIGGVSLHVHGRCCRCWPLEKKKIKLLFCYSATSTRPPHIQLDTRATHSWRWNKGHGLFLLALVFLLLAHLFFSNILPEESFMAIYSLSHAHAAILLIYSLKVIFELILLEYISLKLRGHTPPITW